MKTCNNSDLATIKAERHASLTNYPPVSACFMQNNRHHHPPVFSSDAEAVPIYGASFDQLPRHHDLSPTQCQMDLTNVSKEDITNMGQRMAGAYTSQVDDYKNSVDEICTKVDKLEQGVNEVEQFYRNAKSRKPNTSKGASTIKGKDKEKHNSSMKNLQHVPSRREAAVANRMQELMHHFGSIFREIIDKPMDFSTIEIRRGAKDGTGYKHIREICSDVRLVFKNAMKYNDEKSDVHVMAKKLLDIFEEKWLYFLPKVTEEEKIREEEAEVQMNMQLTQEAGQVKLARDISNELYNIDLHLEELREMVVQKCRHISTLEKKNLGIALTKLCPEDLNKALEIIAQTNPNFQATAQEVELDINAQSESTLWRLKLFVKGVLKGEIKIDDENDTTAANEHDNNIVLKRKQQICNALAKSAKRRKNNPPDP